VIVCKPSQAATLATKRLRSRVHCSHIEHVFVYWRGTARARAAMLGTRRGHLADLGRARRPGHVRATYHERLRASAVTGGRRSHRCPAP
jgi:hypothetical protein